MNSDLKEKFEKTCIERKLICFMLFKEAIVMNSEFVSNIAYDAFDKISKDQIEAAPIAKKRLKIADIIEMKEFINEIFECICIARGYMGFVNIKRK